MPSTQRKAVHLNKPVITLKPQENDSLDAIIRLLKIHFSGHPNLADEQSVRYLRRNLIQCVEFVGSPERLHDLCEQLCGDTTSRGSKTIASLATSRNLAFYLLGGLKRDLLSRYPATKSTGEITSSMQRTTPSARKAWREADHEQDIEEDEPSSYEEYWRQRAESQKELLYDEDGDPIVFDEDGERMIPPGCEANYEPEDVPDWWQVEVDVRTGRHYVLEDGEKVWCVAVDQEDDVAEEDLLRDCWNELYRRKPDVDDD